MLKGFLGKHRKKIEVGTAIALGVSGYKLVSDVIDDTEMGHKIHGAVAVCAGLALASSLVGGKVMEKAKEFKKAGEEAKASQQPVQEEIVNEKTSD
jgi:hypothetical protein